MKPIQRYIKNQSGSKEENRTKSVNITVSQDKFLKKNDLNLSQMVRDMIDEYMAKQNKAGWNGIKK